MSNWITVQNFTQRHKGQPVDLYLAVVPAAEIIRRGKVDVMTTANPEGYQRMLSATRTRQIAKYVLGGVGLLPTSLGINIRSGARFEPSEPDGRYGRLCFDESEPWYVYEGQHRTSGLQECMNRLAIGRNPAELGYELPVTFSIGFSQREEMDLFEVVNKEQRPVPTDLVASIIFNRVTEERGKPEPGKISLPTLRKTAGVAVSRYVSQRVPWAGHIQGVNETKDVVNRPLQASSFAATLLPLTRDRWVHTRFLTNPHDRDFEGLSKIVQLYWETLAELMPEAFADIAHYSVQRPIGVYAFHEILPEIMDACRMEDDWSPKSFKEKLGRLEEWVQSETWHRETGQDIVRGSGNRAAIAVVVERMRTLYYEPLTGLPEE